MPAFCVECKTICEVDLTGADIMVDEFSCLTCGSQLFFLEKAVSYYRSRFDSTHGGVSGAPKFPSSLPVRFLLRQHRQAHPPYLLPQNNF